LYWNDTYNYIPTYRNNNYCIYIKIDSTKSTELNKDIFSSKDLPLVTYDNSGNKVSPLNNSSVDNFSNLELYDHLEPEFKILLENNFEGIEYYNIDNNINKSDDSNQSENIFKQVEHN